MKKHNLFIALIFPVLLTGCIHDWFTDPPTSGTITITAGLPDESSSAPGNGTDMPGTRVVLAAGQDEDRLDVNLTWKNGDKIYLILVQSTIKSKQTVTLGDEGTSISEDGKRATFPVSLALIGDGNFDLYGVHGGGGFDNELLNDGLLKLPTAAQSVGSSLAALQGNNAVMLRFEQKNIPKNDPSLSITFEHLGSLFRIVLNNMGGTTISGITKAELTASAAIQAYQNAGSATYNPLNPLASALSGTNTSGTSLPFTITSADLTAGSSMEFWGWFIPSQTEGDNWPALSLKITYGGGTYTTTTAKPARAAITDKGKAYHFYAMYPGDGNNLLYTGRLYDSRDGNIYQTIKIGDQTWMAENLKYLLPDKIHAGDNGSTTEARYYVYDYTPGDVAGAKGTANYIIYGVLYNFTAATSACPAGWHLPSDAEWTQFTDYLANNGYNYDGTSGGGVWKIAKSMATNSGWTSSIKTGAVGNSDFPTQRNKSGFTGLPGGYRVSSGGFGIIGGYGSWWSSTEDYAGSAWRRYLFYDDNYVYRSLDTKDYGFSVRCVKDA